MGGAVDRLGNDDGRVARELTPSRPCRWLLRRQPRARKKHRKQGTRPPKLRSPLRTTRPVLGATPPPTPRESAPTQATSEHSYRCPHFISIDDQLQQQPLLTACNTAHILPLSPCVSLRRPGNIHESPDPLNSPHTPAPALPSRHIALSTWIRCS